MELDVGYIKTGLLFVEVRTDGVRLVAMPSPTVSTSKETTEEKGSLESNFIRHVSILYEGLTQGEGCVSSDSPICRVTEIEFICLTPSDPDTVKKVNSFRCPKWWHSALPAKGNCPVAAPTTRNFSVSSDDDFRCGRTQHHRGSEGEDLGATNVVVYIPESESRNSEHQLVGCQSNIGRLTQQYLRMFIDFFKRGGFYFSRGFNISTNLQSQFLSDEFKRKYAANNFCWNRDYIKELIALNASFWIVELINGYVSIKPSYMCGNLIEVGIISRRACGRTGVRFLNRGIDQNETAVAKSGHVANFVETEQVLIYRDGPQLQLFSFVQVRGSIPIVWQQLPTLRWSPKVSFTPLSSASANAALKHFESLSELLCHTYLMIQRNIRAQPFCWQRIGEEFRKLTEFKTIHNQHVWFDFHHECRNMRWDRLCILLDQVESDLCKHQYFHVQLPYQEALLRPVSVPAMPNGLSEVIREKISLPIAVSLCGLGGFSRYGTAQIRNLQLGICRSNCMDCLDRTNVVQSVIARMLLHRQLNVLPFSLGQGGNAKNFAPFQSLNSTSMEELFRCLWSDNADALSLLYSGTPALKTDFTRTGKRSILGALLDGKHSVMRYVLNNFTDGYAQDCLDLYARRFQPTHPPTRCANKLLSCSLEFLFLLFAVTTLFPTTAHSVVSTTNLAIINVATALCYLATSCLTYVSQITWQNIFFDGSSTIVETTNFFDILTVPIMQSCVVPTSKNGATIGYCPCFLDDCSLMTISNYNVLFTHTLGLCVLSILLSLAKWFFTSCLMMFFLGIYVYLRGATVATKPTFCRP